MEPSKRSEGGLRGVRYSQSKRVRLSERQEELLRRLAQHWDCDQGEVIRRLIVEAAEREGVVGSPAPSRASTQDAGISKEQTPLAPAGFRAPSPEERTAQERLRVFAERLRAGGHVSAGEMQREIEVLRRHAIIVPAQQSGPPSSEWQEEIRQLLAEVRAGVPEEWSEEELQQHVVEAVAAVREERRARDD
jgi:hypothetical protein